MRVSLMWVMHCRPHSCFATFIAVPLWLCVDTVLVDHEPKCIVPLVCVSISLYLIIFPWNKLGLKSLLFGWIDATRFCVFAKGLREIPTFRVGGMIWSSFEIDFLKEALSEINVFRVLEISFGSFSDRRSKPNANFSGRQHCFGVCWQSHFLEDALNRITTFRVHPPLGF